MPVQEDALDDVVGDLFDGPFDNAAWESGLSGLAPWSAARHRLLSQSIRQRETGWRTQSEIVRMVQQLSIIDLDPAPAESAPSGGSRDRRPS